MNKPEAVKKKGKPARYEAIAESDEEEEDETAVDQAVFMWREP